MFCLYVAIDNLWLVEEILKKLAILASLVAALGVAQAAPTAFLNNVNVGANDITYVPFFWNGDNDGFTVGTSDTSADPELFLLNAAGDTVLAADDDSGPGVQSLLTYITGAVAGNYWIAIGHYQTTDAEAIAGSNPGNHPAFRVDLSFAARDQHGDLQGDFTRVGSPKTTPPSNRVPEPGSLVLAGLGLGIAALVGRRRKQA